MAHDTLILMFHPDPARSRANRALAEAAAAVPGVAVVDMQALYPELRITDLDVEVRRLLAPRRVVLQFPVQWYSTPPLLKAWQDAVLTRMMYLAHEAEGRHLAGKPLLVAATAGNVPAAYTPGGSNGFALDELLRPLQATARRCGMPWATPFLVHGLREITPAQLQLQAQAYAERLRGWVAGTADAPDTSAVAGSAQHRAAQAEVA